MTKRDMALLYASWGWRVLPVVPNGKLPATQHGVHDATTSAEQIARWWSINPEYNVAVAAGAGSGIVVFDIDPRNGGDDSWTKWQQANGSVPDGALQLTAGGGQHHLAVYDDSIKSAKLGDGIDLLSDGRYFLAYPSTIDGRTYQWEGMADPCDGVAPFVIPPAWHDAITAKRKPKERVAQTGGGLIQGNRNDGLTSLAGAMRNFGMTEAEILAAISIANETRCEIPLPASEIRQIAQSVCRYEPDSDVAASAAIGSDAVAAIIAASQADKSDYYLTRATSFLGQPSPIPWLIKGMLPASGTAMLFGPSGAGKSFVALGMACAIASNTPWHHKKTAQGTVVYLAGEGNYGMRQRVASWARENHITNLDNLLISNKAIDIDAPGAAAQIIKAIRALTDGEIVLVIVDTLHNHLSGDENSPRDTRAMLNACNVVAASVGAAVMLVHHTGHNGDRERGSSSWRGALDASLAVMRNENDQDLIEISCRKMKDAPSFETIYGRLNRVDLGWTDEDGEPIEGAVFAIEQNPMSGDKEHKESKPLGEARKMYESAVKAFGEIKNDKPFISAINWNEFTKSLPNFSETSRRQALSRAKRVLVDEKYIEAVEDGYSPTDWALNGPFLCAFLIKK